MFPCVKCFRSPFQSSFEILHCCFITRNRHMDRRSEELVFKISSTKVGVFDISAKYLGGLLKEVTVDHTALIVLLHDSEASEAYQSIAKEYGYSKAGTKIAMARSFSFDVTKLLPYLYECYDKQGLSTIAAKLVEEKHFDRLDALATASGKKKRAIGKEADRIADGDGGGGGNGDSAVDENVRELEELQRAMSSSSPTRSAKGLTGKQAAQARMEALKASKGAAASPPASPGKGRGLPDNPSAVGTGKRTAQARMEALKVSKKTPSRTNPGDNPMYEAGGKR